ncbi:hypothetical protein [Ktedonobacter robiniae]
MAVLIKQQFGVSYHPAHCSRLLRASRVQCAKTGRTGHPKE